MNRFEIDSMIQDFGIKKALQVILDITKTNDEFDKAFCELCKQKENEERMRKEEEEFEIEYKERQKIKREQIRERNLTLPESEWGNCTKCGAKLIRSLKGNFYCKCRYAGKGGR